MWVPKKSSYNPNFQPRMNFRHPGSDKHQKMVPSPEKLPKYDRPALDYVPPGPSFVKRNLSYAPPDAAQNRSLNDMFPKQTSTLPVNTDNDGYGIDRNDKLAKQRKGKAAQSKNQKKAEAPRNNSQLKTNAIRSRESADKLLDESVVLDPLSGILQDHGNIPENQSSSQDGQVRN